MPIKQCTIFWDNKSYKCNDINCTYNLVSSGTELEYSYTNFCTGATFTGQRKTLSLGTSPYVIQRLEYKDEKGFAQGLPYIRYYAENACRTDVGNRDQQIANGIPRFPIQSVTITYQLPEASCPQGFGRRALYNIVDRDGNIITASMLQVSSGSLIIRNEEVYLRPLPNGFSCGNGYRRVDIVYTDSLGDTYSETLLSFSTATIEVLDFNFVDASDFQLEIEGNLFSINNINSIYKQCNNQCPPETDCQCIHGDKKCCFKKTDNGKGYILTAIVDA